MSPDKEKSVKKAMALLRRAAEELYNSAPSAATRASALARELDVKITLFRGLP